MSRFVIEVEVDDRQVPDVRALAEATARSLDTWPWVLDASLVPVDTAEFHVGPIGVKHRESTDLDETYSVTLDGHDLLGLIVTDTSVQVIAWDETDEDAALTLRNIER